MTGYKATAYGTIWMQRLANAMVARMAGAKSASFSCILPVGETRQGIWIRASYKVTDDYGIWTGEHAHFHLLIRRKNFSVKNPSVLRVTWVDPKSRRLARENFLTAVVEELTRGCLEKAAHDCQISEVSQ